MRTRFWSAVVATFLLTACGALRPPRPQPPPTQPPPTTQAMAVVIRDFVNPTEPVPGVLVTCNTVSRGTTNDDGYLSFTVQANYQQDCIFSKDAYEDNSASHYVTANDPTLETWIQKTKPPTPVTPAALVGRLRIEGNCFRDDTGCVLPLYAHAGNLFSLYTRNPSQALLELDKIANAGYHGDRNWSTLGGPYWNGYHVGDYYNPNYKELVQAWYNEHAARHLRFVWSQGDIGYMRDRRDTMAFFATADNNSGGVVDYIDCGNEAWQTGESDPRKLSECVGYYQNAGGHSLKSLTDAPIYNNPGHEKETFEAYSIAPADIFDIHSFRGGHSWDKRRHSWGYTYENPPSKKLGISSEPPGNGTLVSVTSNKSELDDEAVTLLAVGTLVGRQAFVWFSGEGVRIDKGLETEAGFYAVPRMVAKLPRDLMTYETSHHSGGSWSGTRVFAVPQDNVRIDGRISHDGRFIYVIDGPEGSYSIPVEKSFTAQLCDPGPGECVEVSKNAGERLDVAFRRGRVIFGRVH